jgi:hypothetical protein
MVALGSGGIAPGTFTWSNAVLIVLVAAAAFGAPTLYATRAAGARHAWLQTAVWATGAALAMMFWAYGAAQISADDVGGPEVNVNTTETMRQLTEESQSASSWPEEVVLAGRVLIAFAALCGITTGMIAAKCKGVSPVVAAVGFAVAAAVAVATGGLLLIIVVPIAGQLSTMAQTGPIAGTVSAISGILFGVFVAGAGAGAIVESARGLLLAPAPE